MFCAKNNCEFDSMTHPNTSTHLYRGARGDWLCLAQVARGPHCSLLSERRNEILAQRTAHWTLNFDFWLSRCCLTNAYIYISIFSSRLNTWQCLHRTGLLTPPPVMGNPLNQGNVTVTLMMKPWMSATSSATLTVRTCSQFSRNYL